MNLASFPTPSVSSFTIGSLTIHYYGVIIAVGIVLACLVTGLRLRARGADGWLVLDVALWAVPLGILGGRLYHVFTHPADYLYPGANPLAVLFVWEGGLAIFGAILLGAFGAWVGSHFSGLRFGALLDAAAPGVLLAQALGRWGNYFNNELFGRPTDLPWGISIPTGNAAFPVGLPDGTLFHPAFLYESLWDLIGVVVLLWIGRGVRLQWGRLFGAYLIWYGIGRFFIEAIRLDPSEVILGSRVNQLTAVLIVIIGIFIVVVRGRQHPGAEPSPYRADYLEEHPEVAEAQSERLAALRREPSATPTA